MQKYTAAKAMQRFYTFSNRPTDSHGFPALKFPCFSLLLFKPLPDLTASVPLSTFSLSYSSKVLIAGCVTVYCVPLSYFSVRLSIYHVNDRPSGRNDFAKIPREIPPHKTDFGIRPSFL